MTVRCGVAAGPSVAFIRTTQRFAMLYAFAALSLSAARVEAQCTIPHPKEATKMTLSLVPAFVGCENYGAAQVNTTSSGGTAACTPPQTLIQQAGGRWLWDPATSFATLTMQPRSNPPTGSPPALDPPGNTADIKVRLQLRGIIDSMTNMPAGTTGTPSVGRLQIDDRRTVKDRTNGNITWIDYPVIFDVGVVDGQANLTFSYTKQMNTVGQPGMEKCMVLSPIGIAGAVNLCPQDAEAEATQAIVLKDPNMNDFAYPGLFLPGQ